MTKKDLDFLWDFVYDLLLWADEWYEEDTVRNVYEEFTEAIPSLAINLEKVERGEELNELDKLEVQLALVLFDVAVEDLIALVKHYATIIGKEEKRITKLYHGCCIPGSKQILNYYSDEANCAAGVLYFILGSFQSKIDKETIVDLYEYIDKDGNSYYSED